MIAIGAPDPGIQAYNPTKAAEGRVMADSPPPPLEPDPVIEAYQAGIDVTLLRANLARSVTERVLNLMALQRLAEAAREAGRR